MPIPLQPMSATVSLSLAEILECAFWKASGDIAAPAINVPEFLMKVLLEVMVAGLILINITNIADM